MNSVSRPEKTLRKPSLKISGNTVAILVCMAIATLLWLLTKLSDNYIGEVTVPVKYVNLPKDKVLIKPLVNHLTLMVETSGFRLLTGTLSINQPSVTIDFDKYGASDYVLSDNILPSISNDLSADYKLLKIYPDSIYFGFDKKISKMVPVVPDVQISFQKQFDFMEPVVITPESVHLSGPAALTDSLTQWKTEKVVLNNLDQSKELNVKLAPPKNHSLKLSPAEVKLVIPVEEYTEKAMEVEITPVNVPKNLTLNIFPKKVHLTFQVGLSNYDIVNDAIFEAVADFSKVNTNRDRYVDIEITQSPPYIKNLTYTPRSAEYIIYNN